MKQVQWKSSIGVLTCCGALFCASVPAQAIDLSRPALFVLVADKTRAQKCITIDGHEICIGKKKVGTPADGAPGNGAPQGGAGVHRKVVPPALPVRRRWTMPAKVEVTAAPRRTAMPELRLRTMRARRRQMLPTPLSSLASTGARLAFSYSRRRTSSAPSARK